MPFLQQQATSPSTVQSQPISRLGNAPTQVSQPTMPSYLGQPFIDAFNDPKVNITGTTGMNDFIKNFNDPKVIIDKKMFQPQPPEQPKTGLPPIQLNPNDPSSYGGWPTWQANNPQGTLDQFRTLINLPKDDPNAIHGGTGMPYEKKSIFYGQPFKPQPYQPQRRLQ